MRSRRSSRALPSKFPSGLSSISRILIISFLSPIMQKLYGAAGGAPGGFPGAGGAPGGAPGGGAEDGPSVEEVD